MSASHPAPGPVEPFDVSNDEAVAAAHELQVVLDRETLPDDEPAPLEEYRDDLRITPSFRETCRWMVRDDADGRVLGVSVLTINRVEDNQHLADVWVGVRPDARRRGIGRRLLEPALAGARDAGRSLIDSWTVADQIGEEFLQGLGAERRYVERRSRLRVDEVDETMMKEWVECASERATGYSLVGWDGTCPDELLDGYTNVLHVMNTAPLEGLEWEDEVFTPDRIRAKEEAWAKAGMDWWVLVARHDASGEVAGLTEIGFNPHRQWLSFQGNTGVDPNHRERGLGRWLKAAMMLRVIAEKPKVRCVDTWNAGSNRPMLNINEAMGFRPLIYIGGWQVPVDTASEWVAARG